MTNETMEHANSCFPPEPTHEMTTCIHIVNQL